MNYSHLILMWLCIFVKAFGQSGYNHQHRERESLPLSYLRITLAISRNLKLHLNLKLTHRALANKHLPVWVMTEEADSGFMKDGSKLKRHYGVMEKLGGFEFYQDPVMNSAAVYFHRRRRFDGIIDSRYFIQGLSIDKIHPASKTILRVEDFSIISRSPSTQHPTELTVTGEDVLESNIPQYEVRKSYRNRLYVGYPEILVIVSCDLIQKLKEDAVESDLYTTVVSYVLTLFNSVDMLYSKLQETTIQLNIAAIIIVTECKSLSLLPDCYDPSASESQDNQIFMDPMCTIQKIMIYAARHQNKIPLDSYDVVVYLTSNGLSSTKNGRTEQLAGSASDIPVYNTKKSNLIPILVAAIHEDESFINYLTVAHELAHLMNVQHDEGPPTNSGQCCGHIMKKDGTNWCKKCSTWSDASEKAFKTFFSSADCCGFTNYPRSLDAKGPRKMLTADEQCQCYGYKSTITSMTIGDKYCVTALLCQDDNDEFHTTVLPLDGTQCGIDKVCWSKVCKEIGDVK